MKMKAWLIMGIIIGSSLFFICSAQSQSVEETIDNLVKDRLRSNESLAKERIDSISMASESYATMSEGNYPSSLNDLINSKPPYIYAALPEGTQGYKYSLESKPNYYKIVATPLECGKTGNKVFIKERDKEITEQNCQ